jgi:hypothetical protein
MHFKQLDNFRILPFNISSSTCQNYTYSIAVRKQRYRLVLNKSHTLETLSMQVKPLRLGEPQGS